MVALDEAFRAERGADVAEQSLVTAAFTRAITGSPRFSHVTDVSTELPNPSGLEGLVAHRAGHGQGHERGGDDGEQHASGGRAGSAASSSPRSPRGHPEILPRPTPGPDMGN